MKLGANVLCDLDLWRQAAGNTLSKNIGIVALPNLEAAQRPEVIKMQSSKSSPIAEIAVG